MDHSLTLFEPPVRALPQCRMPSVDWSKPGFLTRKRWRTGNRESRLSYCQELVRYWREEYDWQRVPRQLSPVRETSSPRSPVSAFTASNIRSPHTQAQPLLITHGWPGSVLEFLNIIEPLTDPTTAGGDPSDAFHLVIPSSARIRLLGSAFTAPGVGVGQIAAMWDTLMQRLGYESYIAQGGDWGSLVTHALLLHPGTHCPRRTCEFTRWCSRTSTP